MDIIKDVDPIFETEKYDVIMIGTSTHNMLTNGFQNKIRNKYPVVEEENNKTKYGDKGKLGTVKIVDCIQPVVALMYVYGYPNSNKCYLSYESLDKGLGICSSLFKGKKIMSTLIGSSKYDGNGDKDIIMKMFEKHFKDEDLTLYTCKQYRRVDELNHRCGQIWMKYHMDIQKFNEIWPNRYKIVKETYYV